MSCEYTGPSAESLSSGTMQELASNLGSGQWSTNKLGHTWNTKCIEVKDALLSINLAALGLCESKAKTPCQFLEQKNLPECHL